MRFLRTNTATRITVGPFLDKTDGVTPEVALTVTSEKLTLMVDDGGVPTLVLDTAPTASGGANDMVHVTGDDAGFYDLELAAANVNYLGRAMLALTDAATHCPVFHEFMIMPALVYDTYFASSGGATFPAATLASTTNITAGTVTTTTNLTNLPAITANWLTATGIAADAITAAKIADGAIDLATFAADAKALMGVIAFGTAQSVTGTTIQLAAAETFADDEIIGATVLIRSATTGAGQARVITDYVSATDTATVDTWTTTPTGTITYIVIATAPASASAPIAANVVQLLGTAWLTPATAGTPDVNAKLIGGQAVTASGGITFPAATLASTTNITAGTIATVSGNVNGSVGSVTGAVGSVTGAVGSVTGNVGGNVVGAVASVTGAVGSVTATVNADIKKVNGVTVNGDGAGTPWGP